jgi:hypothetical protein
MQTSVKAEKILLPRAALNNLDADIVLKTALTVSPLQGRHRRKLLDSRLNLQEATSPIWTQR